MGMVFGRPLLEVRREIQGPDLLSQNSQKRDKKIHETMRFQYSGRQATHGSNPREKEHK